MTVTGASIVSAAEAYDGYPYKFGGYTPKGWDCSGFANYILGYHLGMTLPGGAKYTGKSHGPIAAQYLTWTGATTISASEAQPGDLCCWQTHVGFYVGAGDMFSAFTAARGTLQTPVTWGPTGEKLSYRRIKAATIATATEADYSVQTVAGTPAASGCGATTAVMLLTLPVSLPYLAWRARRART